MTVVERYEQRSMAFSSWLLRVAHNVAIDHVRTRRAVPCEELPLAQDRIGDDPHDCAQSLRTALWELPREQRPVLVLRHLFGFSPGEIAERMGKTDDGLHHRGRRSARQRLRTLGSAPSTVQLAAD
jgi:RNA polymerase sigma-70 factor, ECF subfamily